MEQSTTGKLVLRVTGGILRWLLNILFYVVVVLLVVKASTYAYHFAYETFGSVSVDPEPGRVIEFQITQGESTMDIANKLEVSRLIVNKNSFYLKTKLKEYNIMPGTFLLNTSMDYNEVLGVITDIKNSIVEEESTTP